MLNVNCPVVENKPLRVCSASSLQNETAVFFAGASFGLSGKFVCLVITFLGKRKIAISKHWPSPPPSDDDGMDVCVCVGWKTCVILAPSQGGVNTVAVEKYKYKKLRSIDG